MASQSLKESPEQWNLFQFRGLNFLKDFAEKKSKINTHPHRPAKILIQTIIIDRVSFYEHDDPGDQ